MSWGNGDALYVGEQGTGGESEAQRQPAAIQAVAGTRSANAAKAASDSQQGQQGDIAGPESSNQAMHQDAGSSSANCQPGSSQSHGQPAPSCSEHMPGGDLVGASPHTRATGGQSGLSGSLERLSEGVSMAADPSSKAVQNQSAGRPAAEVIPPSKAHLENPHGKNAPHAKQIAHAGSTQHDLPRANAAAPDQEAVLSSQGSLPDNKSVQGEPIEDTSGIPLAQQQHDTTALREADIGQHAASGHPARMSPDADEEHLSLETASVAVDTASVDQGSSKCTESHSHGITPDASHANIQHPSLHQPPHAVARQSQQWTSCWSAATASLPSAQSDMGNAKQFDGWVEEHYDPFRGPEQEDMLTPGQQRASQALEEARAMCSNLDATLQCLAAAPPSSRRAHSIALTAKVVADRLLTNHSKAAEISILHAQLAVRRDALVAARAHVGWWKLRTSPDLEWEITKAIQTPDIAPPAPSQVTPDEIEQLISSEQARAELLPALDRLSEVKHRLAQEVSCLQSCYAAVLENICRAARHAYQMDEDTPPELLEVEEKLLQAPLITARRVEACTADAALQKLAIYKLICAYCAKELAAEQPPWPPISPTRSVSLWPKLPCQERGACWCGASC